MRVTSDDIYKEIERMLTKHQDEKSANLLIPSLSLKTAPGSIFVPELESIVISAVTDDNEVYPGTSKDGNKQKKMRLSSKALDKIAQAGKIEWDSNNSGPIIGLPGNTKAHKSSGGIRKGTGEMMGADGYKEISLDIELEEIEENYRKKLAGDWYSNKSPDQRKNMAEEFKTRDFMQKKKTAPERAETGSRDRVIRKLFMIKSEYSLAELSRPFIVLRFRPHLDHEDPAIRVALQASSLQAAGAIFGPGTIPVGSGASQPMRISAPINAADDPNIIPEDPAEEPPLQEVPAEEPKQENTEETPPSNAIADFRAADHGQRIKAVSDLMTRKGYEGPATGTLSKDSWKDGDHLENFFSHLMGMPDKEDRIKF